MNETLRLQGEPQTRWGRAESSVLLDETPSSQTPQTLTSAWDVLDPESS